MKSVIWKAKIIAESGPSLDFVNSFIGTQPHMWSMAAFIPKTE